jgi:hypothetical protein
MSVVDLTSYELMPVMVTSLVHLTSFEPFSEGMSAVDFTLSEGMSVDLTSSEGILVVDLNSSAGMSVVDLIFSEGMSVVGTSSEGVSVVEIASSQGMSVVDLT